MATNHNKYKQVDDWLTDGELQAMGVDWFWHEHCGEVCFQNHSGVKTCDGQNPSPCPLDDLEFDCSPTSDGTFSCVHLIQIGALSEEDRNRYFAAKRKRDAATGHTHGPRTARAWDRNTYEMIQRGKKWVNRPARPPK